MKKLNILFWTYLKQEKIAVIDLKCAQAILRGADLFLPGIISLSFDVKNGDLISIYVDLRHKCLKGSDPISYLNSNPDSMLFIANGYSMFSRNDIFKSQTFTS